MSWQNNQGAEFIGVSSVTLRDSVLIDNDNHAMNWEGGELGVVSYSILAGQSPLFRGGVGVVVSDADIAAGLYRPDIGLPDGAASPVDAGLAPFPTNEYSENPHSGYFEEWWPAGRRYRFDPTLLGEDDAGTVGAVQQYYTQKSLLEHTLARADGIKARRLYRQAKQGIRTPDSHNFRIDDVIFQFFEQGNTSCIVVQSGGAAGGFTQRTSRLAFDRATTRVDLSGDHDGVLIDEDGSIQGGGAVSADPGYAGAPIVPSASIFPLEARCRLQTWPARAGDPRFDRPSSVCPGMTFRRVHFHGHSPGFDDEKPPIRITSPYGSSGAPLYKHEDVPFKSWVVVLYRGGDFRPTWLSSIEIDFLRYTLRPSFDD